MATNPHDIVPAHLAVQAMRDNGYKNAAYAIAELMDNSIQAGATQVELLCGEKKQQVGSRMRSRIHQVAVLDNGSGMDATVLRKALQFGNGTHLEEKHRKGIGKFGMGLPSSSVSQCQRVEVWTWQNGTDSCLYSYLDINEIKQGSLIAVPEAQNKSIPAIWIKVAKNFGLTGTLVVWSNIDRCFWRTGKAIINNSEFLIGRMYRKFLDPNIVQKDKKVAIRMLPFNLDNPDNIDLENEKYAQPNDPGYLMVSTSCPKPFDNRPMFEAYPTKEQNEADYIINFRDQKHIVKVRFSYATEEARKSTATNQRAGSLPHGKHAKKNIGISIVRAGRELEIDRSLVDKRDPKERWWGVEVEFPPSLDDLFGVTNNKQSARNFTELINVDVKSLCKEYGVKSVSQLKEKLSEDEDPKAPLIEIAHKIQTQLDLIRSLIEKQNINHIRQNRHNPKNAEKKATTIVKERQAEGYIGKSDLDEQTLTEETRTQELQQALIDDGETKEQAQLISAKIVQEGLKYEFRNSPINDSSAFFSVKSQGGAIIVTLNTNHPAYQNLVEVLQKDVDNADLATLRSRLQNSLEGLKLLFMAWARYEDEQLNESQKARVREVREDWGRVARRFLEQEE